MSELGYYASRTGTRRNLEALHLAGFGLMVSPLSPRTEGFRYALDNGAWTAFTKRRPLDVRAFGRALTRLGPGADFVVVPDCVANREETLVLSRRWLDCVLSFSRRALLVIQDGMTEEDLAPARESERVSLFLGGSTDFKRSTLEQWGALARSWGRYLHVGRVNGTALLHRCASAGAASADGSGVSRFSVEVPRFRAALDQSSMVLT